MQGRLVYLTKRERVWRLGALCTMGSTISTVSGKRKHSECEDEEGSQTEEDDAVVDVVKRYVKAIFKCFKLELTYHFNL